MGLCENKWNYQFFFPKKLKFSETKVESIKILLAFKYFF